MVKPRHQENMKWNHTSKKSVNPGVVINYDECSQTRNCQIDDFKKSINKPEERQPLKEPKVIGNYKDWILPMIRCSNRFDILRVDELDEEENGGNREDMEYIKKKNQKGKETMRER